MKEDQNTNELRQIRRALLQAAKEDYLEALKDAPEAPPFSKNHRRWERRFLKDPLLSSHPPSPTLAARLAHRRLLRFRHFRCLWFRHGRQPYGQSGGHWMVHAEQHDPRFLCILRNGRSWRNALLETDRFARGLSSDRVY